MQYLRNENRKLIEVTLQAFTIIELIVASIISAIVFGLIAWLLLIYSGKMNSNIKLLFKNSDINLFDSRLQRDVLNCDKILFEDSTLFFMSFQRQSKIKYIFSFKAIERVEENVVDKFDIDLLSYKFQFIPASEVVEGINFTIAYGNSGYVITAQKQYSYAQLLLIKNSK